jgi:hypothetical protein
MNIYGASKFGMAGTYDHKFRPASLEEMVKFDGIIHHHGIWGGGPGIHLCWDPTDSDYDDCVYNAMAHTRFLQLKRLYKLNNNFLAPNCNQPRYNPAYKYDMIYKMPFYNVNWVTKKAGIDQCGNKLLGALADTANLVADLCLVSSASQELQKGGKWS